MRTHAPLPRRTSSTSSKSTTSGGPGPAPRHPPGPERIPSTLARSLGGLLGVDATRVRIFPHDHETARAGASAITEGDRIRFSPGQYRPDHPRGRGLLAHELAHVAQQRRASSGEAPATGPAVAEAEAERAGARASRGLPTRVTTAAWGPQARMGFEFQVSSNTIEYGYGIAGTSPRWEPAPRKSATFHGWAGAPHVRLEPDSRGDTEFVTHPYVSRRGLIGEVQEAHDLTRHILSWTRLPGESSHVRLAQRAHGSGTGDERRIHRGRHWATMDQVNREKGGRPADAVRMRIGNRHFPAMAQSTEGVRLEEIEGFFAQNLAGEPAAERDDAIRSYVDGAVLDPASHAAFSALPGLSQRRVRGFISMVTALFLYSRRYAPGHPVLKSAFSILHRTRVSAVYASLGAAEQTFVRERVFAAGSDFLAHLGVTRGERVFPRGYDTGPSVARRAAAGRPTTGPRVRGALPGPTVGQWFDTIVRPERRVVRDDGERRRLRTDALSPVAGASTSMGALGMDEAPDGSESLVVLEVRNWAPQLEAIRRRALTAEYNEAVEEAERTGSDLILAPWQPGMGVPSVLPVQQWVEWAHGVLARARAAGRADNMRP